MLNIKLIYFKNKGLTLMEVILALGLTSIIILSLFTLLNVSTKASDLGEQKDELLLNGRYGIEYIKGEIKNADKIISSSRIEGLNRVYPTNIGFVIMIHQKSQERDEFKYITYYVRNSNLARIVCTKIIPEYPTEGCFSGHNVMSELIHDINNSKLEVEQSMIYLDFKLKHHDEDLNIKADIYIRSPIDY